MKILHNSGRIRDISNNFSFLSGMRAYIFSNKIVSVVFAALIGASLCLNSASAETLQIDGIEVSCSACVNYGDGRCVIDYQGSPTILPCSEALDQLMTDAVTGRGLISVSDENLLRYLSTVRRDPETSRIVIERLLQSGDAETILLKNLERILSWYSEPLRELMLTGKINKQYLTLLRSIFEEPEDGTAIRTELRIIAALLHPEITLRDISFQLGFAKVTYELERLRVWTTTAELLEHPWASEFKKIYYALDICKALDEGETFPAACSAANLGKLGEPFADYANKYVMTTLKEQISREMLDATEILKRYSQTDYINHRTEATHLTVIEAIQDLLSNRNPIDAQTLLSEPLQTFLTLLAKNDKVIAENYIKLLLKLSLTFWQSSQYDEALKAMETSFAVSFEPISARAKLLDDFRSAGVVLSERQHRKLDSFYEQEVINSYPLAIVAAVLATVMLFIYLLRGRIVTFSRPAVTIAKVYNTLTFNERYELKEVLSYFGLTVSASYEDLGRAYRLRAKALHPDSQTGNIKEFNLLTSRYQRARKLLKKAA